MARSTKIFVNIVCSLVISEILFSFKKKGVDLLNCPKFEETVNERVSADFFLAIMVLLWIVSFRIGGITNKILGTLQRHLINF